MSPTTNDRVSTALRKAARSTNALPSSLADASPAQLQRAHKDVRALTRRLDAEVASQLGVTINLSDTDGDS
jgi:hypothetical protein